MIPATGDHPKRYALSNELHARPFPELSAPGQALFLALHVAPDADRALDRTHLLALLDRHGAAHPPEGASHHSAILGRDTLKWEQHTEFVTYTLFSQDAADPPFTDARNPFPADWLAAAPGKVLTACTLVLRQFEDDAQLTRALETELPAWFVSESLAVSSVQDGDALIGGDFRIDNQGLMRFAVLARQGLGRRRLGRVVQRLLEIETYKSAAMLTLPVAREISGKLARLDRDLTAIVQTMAEGSGSDAATLDRLLAISAEVELAASASAFRFGAAGAYADIVAQRIEDLRETRVAGRQTFREFMTRRFNPAMRTCRSAEERLEDLAARAGRTANLLRTRVDVADAARNAQVLRRMDERAALQLRLQETVEGLSVVAISYYAVNLAANLALPFGARVGLDKTLLLAGLTLPVVAIVWIVVRRIRKRGQKP